MSIGMPTNCNSQADRIRVVSSSASTPDEVLIDLKAEAAKLRGALIWDLERVKFFLFKANLIRYVIVLYNLKHLRSDT